MKIFVKFAIAALFVVLLLITGCSAVTPDAGYEAVLVKKPWIFGHGGVDVTPVTTGRTFVAPSTDAVMVYMLPIQKTEHFEDLMSADGVPLDFDAALRVKITDSVQLIRNFGPQWYEQNLAVEFRNRVRQAVRKHGMNETAINTQAVEAIDTEVTRELERYIAEAKLPVQLIQMTVGKANPPDSVKNQRIETAAQEQRVMTEQKRKLAENSRQAAEQARAEADNAFRNAMQMSPEQYLRLEAINMQREVCSGGNCTFVITDGKTAPVMAIK